jgi:hypothetical protein
MNPASIGSSGRGKRSTSRETGLRRPIVAAGILLATAGVLAVLGGLAEPVCAAPAATADSSAASSAGGALLGGPTSLPYPREYPAIPYAQMPRDNAIARLQARLDRGEVKLAFRPPRGYLDSILAALGIDRSSQTLVYSKTSLQTGDISAATPRAIYFDDDTYVAWVQGGNIEIGTMDSRLGQVFYTISNQPVRQVRFDRQIMDCLSCHDTYELSGGGVPRFLLMSTYVDTQGNQLTHEGQILTFDDTPLKFRWSGWYVTGQSGNQVHLGNVLVHDVQQLVHLDQVRRGNLDTLQGLFDTRPYLTDKSDIVALLVLQHQVDVENLITRVSFEVRTALAKVAAPSELSEKARAALKPYLDSLVSAMLFVDATRFTSPISGNSGFTAWFESRGPRDREGRSLRDFDLKTRLFKYPLSYLIYTPAFDALPSYAKDYLYGRFADYLTDSGTITYTDAREGQEADEGSSESSRPPPLSADDRKAILAILAQTKPDFGRFLATRGPHAAARQ